MPSAGFEPATPATKRPQTYALHRSATEVGVNLDLRTVMNTVAEVACYLFNNLSTNPSP
jgi:hypothetical protein